MQVMTRGDLRPAPADRARARRRRRGARSRTSRASASRRASGAAISPRAQRLAARLETGTAVINDTTLAAGIAELSVWRRQGERLRSHARRGRPPRLRPHAGGDRRPLRRLPPALVVRLRAAARRRPRWLPALLARARARRAHRGRVALGAAALLPRAPDLTSGLARRLARRQLTRRDRPVARSRCGDRAVGPRALRAGGGPLPRLRDRLAGAHAAAEPVRRGGALLPPGGGPAARAGGAARRAGRGDAERGAVVGARGGGRRRDPAHPLAPRAPGRSRCRWRSRRSRRAGCTRLLVHWTFSIL